MIPHGKRYIRKEYKALEMANAWVKTGLSRVISWKME